MFPGPLKPYQGFRLDNVTDKQTLYIYIPLLVLNTIEVWISGYYYLPYDLKVTFNHIVTIFTRFLRFLLANFTVIKVLVMLLGQLTVH